MDKKTELKVLPTERLVSLKDLKDVFLWDAYEIYKKDSLDVILIYVNDPQAKTYEVGTIILNTAEKNDGQWRYILGLQGKDYKKDGKFFTYYFMPNHTKDMVLFLLERYFILEIQIQAG